MLNLKRRTPAIAGFPTHVTQEDYDEPLPSKPTSTISFGADFNLIRMVEEYGPKRLADIAKESQALQDRLDTLAEEARQITNLVAALKD
jgi:hypothetical protein